MTRVSLDMPEQVFDPVEPPEPAQLTLLNKCDIFASVCPAKANNDIYVVGQTDSWDYLVHGTVMI